MQDTPLSPSAAYHIFCHQQSNGRLQEQLDIFLTNLPDSEHLSLFIYPEWDNVIRKGTKQHVFRFTVTPADDKRHVLATCSLTFIPSKLFTRKLCSVGFFTAGNLVYTDTHALDSLLSHLQKWAKNLGVDYIEWKQGDFSLDLVQKHGLQEINNLYAGFEKYLPEEASQLLDTLPRKRRANIRKALTHKEFTFFNQIDVQDFYDIFAIAQRNHGTPVHGVDFFKAILEYIPSTKICGLFFKDKLVAACMVFSHQQICMPYYVGVSPDYTTYGIYDRLYYHIMQMAIEEGRTVFDFGRSKINTGSYDYKKLWGISPALLCYTYMPILKNHIHIHTPLSPNHQWKIKIWRKLPVWLANFLSRFISQHLG